jgi:hypothetical protein
MLGNYRLNDKSIFKVSELYEANSQESLKKFNMRIHKTDLKMIDELAKRDGVSRALLLNKLIYRIIETFLKSFKNEDFEARILLIKEVDKLNGVDALRNPEDSWFSDIFREAMDAAIQQSLMPLDGTTDLYKKMAKMLEDAQLKLQQPQEKSGDKS